jgi:methyl-accepting chemotaxis protein
MEAVQHLRAAGLNEPAESLEQMAHKMREEFERRGAPVGAERMEQAFGEIREGMEQLRRQMEKMQQELKELRERAAKS